MYIKTTLGVQWKLPAGQDQRPKMADQPAKGGTLINLVHMVYRSREPLAPGRVERSKRSIGNSRYLLQGGSAKNPTVYTLNGMGVRVCACTSIRQFREKYPGGPDGGSRVAQQLGEQSKSTVQCEQQRDQLAQIARLLLVAISSRWIYVLSP